MAMDKKQPTLHLMQGSKALSLEHLLSFYKKLTGRDPTPGEIEEVKRKLEERKARF
jgi:pyruvate/2-oxoacid:ferredoxin oxidoreductase alpha subunit